MSTVKTRSARIRLSTQPIKATSAVRVPWSSAKLLAGLAEGTVSAWVLLPLRLFLGITFVYAGAQKLTDPQYFRPGTAGYIGRQISAFAAGSPLHSFLSAVALPHAAFFGSLVAWGELAIGLGTLAGLLLRPAAFFGLLINMVFFLSATWRVHPYFYGSDIVFAFAWLTLALAGANAMGGLALDSRLAPRLIARLGTNEEQRLDRVAWLVLGLTSTRQVVPSSTELVPQDGRQSASARSASAGRQLGAIHARPEKVPVQAGHRRSRYSTRQRPNRREFLWGAASGAVGMVLVTLLGHQLGVGEANSDGTGGGAVSIPAVPASSAATQGATSSTVIAKANAVANNSAVGFTVPANGDQGVLVRLNSGQLVAFDATCTHAGCPVQYDPGSGLLICPCHGAEFDPAHAGAVVQGPAGYPLTSVAINLDSHSGDITVSQ